MVSLPFALYDAFSSSTFGGSQAGIISDAAGLDSKTRLLIARELGWPATCFVEAAESHIVTARFQSTVREYPMCGHGTICLMTRLIDTGVLNWDDSGNIDVVLKLPASEAKVEIVRQTDGRALVLLDVSAPSFRDDNVDKIVLATLLGIDASDFHDKLPVEIAVGDFVHLVVPLIGLSQMRKLKPDFEKLADYCREIGVETVAVFCSEVEIPGNDIHVRDFCPAVGVNESAAAGTTNAALSGYLVRHSLVNGVGVVRVTAEQGHELDRASQLHSTITIANGEIERLQIGGVATKIFDGQFHLPSEKQS